MKLSTDRGFTLVEILVVIAVMSALGTVLLSAVQNARQSAQIARSTSALRHLVQANFAHAADNNGSFAFATNRNNSKRWSAGLVAGRWDRSAGYLSPYLDQETSAFNCPLLAEVLDPSVPSFELGTGGFGYNSAYIGGSEGNERFPAIPSARAATVEDPARTIMFGSTAYARSGGLQEYPFVEPPFHVNTRDGTTRATRFSPTLHFRARGKAMVAWVDGRVSLESPAVGEHGHNPHGGDSRAESLGWFGPEINNGYWNPGNRWSGTRLVED